MADAPRRPESLITAVSPGEGEGLTEAAWIEVVQKMDEVYSDLIRYEVDLEKKNAALEQAQQFISSVLASVSDVFIVCDQKGRIQQVNQALLDLTGHAEGEVLGQPLRFLLDETSCTATLTMFARIADGLLRDVEVRFKGPDGQVSDPVAVNCSPRIDESKRPAGLVIIGRPVGELRRAYEALNAAHAELKQAQAQLVQAEKMASLGRLVAGVAHELNNPISFVYGNVHTLDRYRGRLEKYLAAVHAGVSEAEREELRRSLRIDAMMADLGPLIDGTLEGAVRVSEIVKNLRRLSFVNPGDRGTVDLVETIGTAVSWVTKGQGKGVRTEVSLPEHLTVSGHVGPLHQVMVNLVQNALDAVDGRDDAAVEITAARRGDKVVVTVADNGPGIPDEALLKVFDPFFTTKPVGQGTGLGLWISYSILRDHGGGIEAANRDGGGALFTVTLPAG